MRLYALFRSPLDCRWRQTLGVRPDRRVGIHEIARQGAYERLHLGQFLVPVRAVGGGELPRR